MRSEIREEAINCFYNERLHRTRDANGILVFISVFESRVGILADSGINEKIDPHTWQEIIDELSGRIAKNNRCDVLCQAIERIGTILQDHFPHKKDDVNELRNLIIR